MDDFGAYLKAGKFSIKTFSNASINRANISELSDKLYIHHYRGLIRLLKTSSSHSETTLEKIYEGADITVPYEDEYILVPIQSSLAECAQGISKYIELRKGQKITIDDLIFVQNELRGYIKNVPEEKEDSLLALKKFVTEHMKKTPILKPKSLWSYFQNLVENSIDRCEVITEVRDWEDPDTKLFYKTSEGTDEKAISKKRFQNLVSEIKKSPSFKF